MTVGKPSWLVLQEQWCIQACAGTFCRCKSAAFANSTTPQLSAAFHKGGCMQTATARVSPVTHRGDTSRVHSHVSRCHTVTTTLADRSAAAAGRLL
jgi:hypothetical protein